MPTKQQYLDNYRKILVLKEQMDEKYHSKYDAMVNQMIQGKGSKQWFEEQKEALNKERNEYTSTDKYTETYEAADEYARNKYEKIQAKIEGELEKQIDSAKNNNHAREYTDLTSKRDYYNMSLSNLKFWNGKDTRSFPDSLNGLKGWSIGLEEYLPYKHFAQKMKEFDEREKDLQELEDIIEKDGVFKEQELSLKTLSEKKESFNSLNGWQKFWARVLPASWYSNAGLYADMKAQESAIRELGFTGEKQAEVSNNAPATENAGEPLPEEKLMDLQQKTNLNGPTTDKQNQINFDDIQSEVDLNESMEINEEGL